MNIQDRPVDWSLQKFGVGQPVPRSEDPQLVRGEGRYTDDINLPGQAYAAIVRSRHAHGTIRKIDLAAARAMPGVLAAYTAADLTAYGTLKCGVPFNNLFADCVQGTNGAPRIDFAAHAASLGAMAENVKTIPELEAALARARAADRTYVIAIETDPNKTTAEGAWWWDVAVPEVSERAEVRRAREQYENDKKQQRP